jgi:hypothetical protein
VNPQSCSITVNQEGIKSFASALLNAQEYEIFIDDQNVGVLNGYRNGDTCATAPGTHSIYVRAYARNSVSITRVYGYGQTLEVQLSPGENKRFPCGIVRGPLARKPLVLTSAFITILLALGLGPVSHIPERTRHASTLVMSVVTMASSWHGHSSVPGKSIHFTEA